MGTRQRVVDFILEQMSAAPGVTARKMFGEFAIYSTGKVVALVCDDQLFVKPTDAGKSWIGTVTEGEPYPGAKPCFLIEGDRWEDGDWLSELVRLTANALPMPKSKSLRSRSTRASARSTPGARVQAEATPVAKRRVKGQPKAPSKRQVVGQLEPASKRKAIAKPKATSKRQVVGELKTASKRKAIGQPHANTDRRRKAKSKVGK
jgi:TfoX/Sxy family transcriptional regulator of competence genes